MPRSSAADLKKERLQSSAKVYLMDGSLAKSTEPAPPKKTKRPKKKAKLTVIEEPSRKTRAKPKRSTSTKRTTTKKAPAKTKARSVKPQKQRVATTRTSKTKDIKSLTISAQQWRKAYQIMLQARLIDEKITVLYKQSRSTFHISCAGHEAVQAAAGHVFRADKDWFFPYYRDMALMTALGMTSQEMLLNAMNKEADPNSHGRQMPAHWSAPKLRVMSQSSPVGSQFPQAVGCALASRRRGLKEVIYVSSGDGACSQGDFHEALNWAAREKLPIIFLIQNNGYAISVNVADQLAGGSAAKIAAGYQNLNALNVDGTDYAECYRALKQAHARALKGDGPSLIEAMVPRLRSHSISDDQTHYRDASELEQDRKRCPIGKTKRYLLRCGITTNAALKSLETNLKAEIDEAADWAHLQPAPNPATISQFSNFMSRFPRLT